MKKNSISGLSEVEKQSAFSRAFHSIRTRYSFATGIFLLLALGIFYAGGRVVLVHLVRDTEKQVKEIGSDLARIACHNADRVRKDARSVLPKEGEGPVDTARIVATPGYTLAAVFDADGKFVSGHCRTWDKTEPLDAAVLAPYEETLRDWTVSTLRNADKATAVGILRLGSATHHAAMMSFGNSGCVLVGVPFDAGAFSAKSGESFSGLDVRIVNRKAEISVRATLPREIARSRDRGGFGIVPMFSEAANFYTGGFWELGSSQIEAIYAIRDIAGNAVSMVTVSIPKTFSSVASAAVERLSFFVAVLGLIFVLPIFWFQSRVLLNPLTKMTKQIAELGRHNAEVDCPRLEWKGKDEFALLAISVNRMLETISARSISIAQTEARHQALIDCIPDTLAIFDPLGRLVAISKEAENVGELPGISPGEPPSAETFGLESVEKFLKIIGEVFREGAVGKMQLRVRRSAEMSVTEPTRTFEIRLTRMDEYFALAIIRDVTDEMNEHRLRLVAESKVKDTEKRESLTLLAAGIAHDMNNVLSVVLGAAESQDVDPSGDSAQALRTIRSAVRRGSAMMRELSTFAGVNRISLVRANPALIVEDIKMLAEGAVKKNILIEYSIGKGVPDIDVDVNQFWKVIFNIVKNAGEAIGDAPGQIRISVSRHELQETESSRFLSTAPLRPGPGALFTIADNGPGIPDEIRTRLFDPYVSSKSVGRGLGLATVRTIIESHGGGLLVESVKDRGTAFSIFLPESRLPPESALKEDPVTTLSAAAPEGANEVLIVDDEEPILRTTSMLVKVLKYVPRVARDSQEALGIVRRYSSNLKAILLDADLGGVTSARLLGALRESAPRVPVIITTGSSEETVQKLFASSPYDAFLAKPYTLDELRNAICCTSTEVEFPEERQA